jgi:ribosomal protein S18 acetylase RimI-like enzyme
VVQYRSFSNLDPPGLAAIWNEAFTGRGEVRLHHSSPLENFVFAKPYFDREGLIVAVEEGTPVGFVHAGFGANPAHTGVGFDKGVICLIAVRPSHRRRGIGSELLRRSEEYLGSRGTRSIHAGPMAPRNPFYFGLYGGSDMPGFLSTDSEADPFFRRHGYQEVASCRVLQRPLSRPCVVPDGRFQNLRRKYDVRIVPRAGPAPWFEECAFGPIEAVEFRLEDKGTGQVVGITSVWEMEGFSARWNLPAVGILDLLIREDVRRQGLAKFLLAQMVRYLQEQFYGVAEVHCGEADDVAVKLYTGLGFEQVDTGRSYKK